MRYAIYKIGLFRRKTHPFNRFHRISRKHGKNAGKTADFPHGGQATGAAGRILATFAPFAKIHTE